jgi:glucose/mannose-6-phosphate isomerase
VYGELPETAHNQVMAFDGFFAGGGGGGGASGDPDDFFRDRADEAEHGLHLVMLADTDEHPQVARRREVAVDLARARGVAVTQLAAEGDHPLERIVSLIALADYITVYLAIAVGADPTPVPAIDELKARIADT